MSFYGLWDFRVSRGTGFEFGFRGLGHSGFFFGTWTWTVFLDLDFLTVSAKDLVLSVVSRILVRFSLDLDFGSWFS